MWFLVLPWPWTCVWVQNKFLQPDAKVVDALVAQLQAKQIGVVAHFYMDPEVQGVLSSAGKQAVRPCRCRRCCHCCSLAGTDPSCWSAWGRRRLPLVLLCSCSLLAASLRDAPHLVSLPCPVQPSAGPTLTSAIRWSWRMARSRWLRPAASECSDGLVVGQGCAWDAACGGGAEGGVRHK